MTLLREATIPDEFIKLDATITDADAFSNVRDQQVVRENHNILLAQRVHRPLVTQVFREVGGWTTAGQAFKHHSHQVSVDNPQGAVLAQWDVEVPPFVTALIFRVRCYVSNGGGDATVFPFVGTTPSTEDATAITNTAIAETEIDVGVSSGTRNAFTTTVGLLYSCGSYGAAQEDPQTVAWADNLGPFVVSTTPSVGTTVGDVLYFTTPALTIEPRTIVEIESITVDGSTYERIWVDRPWDVVPQTGNAYNTMAVDELVVESVAICPKAISDFYESSFVV